MKVIHDLCAFTKELNDREDSVGVMAEVQHIVFLLNYLFKLWKDSLNSDGQQISPQYQQRTNAIHLKS